MITNRVDPIEPTVISSTFQSLPIGSTFYLYEGLIVRIVAEYQALNPNQEVITTTFYFNGAEINLPTSVGVGELEGVNYNIRAGTINGDEVLIYKAVDINREIFEIMFSNPSEVNITFEVSSSCITTSFMTVHKVIYHILNFGKYI